MLFLLNIHGRVCISNIFSFHQTLNELALLALCTLECLTNSPIQLSWCGIMGTG